MYVYIYIYTYIYICMYIYIYVCIYIYIIACIHAHVTDTKKHRSVPLAFLFWIVSWLYSLGSSLWLSAFNSVGQWLERELAPGRTGLDIFDSKQRRLLLWHWLFETGGYPGIIHFSGIFHYKPTILGVPHLWKPPYEFIWQTWWSPFTCHTVNFRFWLSFSFASCLGSATWRFRQQLCVKNHPDLRAISNLWAWALGQHSGIQKPKMLALLAPDGCSRCLLRF